MPATVAGGRWVMSPGLVMSPSMVLTVHGGCSACRAVRLMACDGAGAQASGMRADLVPGGSWCRVGRWARQAERPARA